MVLYTTYLILRGGRTGCFQYLKKKYYCIPLFLTVLSMYTYITETSILYLLKNVHFATYFMSHNDEDF